MLKWVLENIANWETVCAHPDDHEKLNPVTNAIIEFCMYTGVDRITEENWETFYLRLRMIERASGAILQDKLERPYFITVEDVRKHIGLFTNADRKTPNQFRAHVARILFELAEEDLKKGKTEADDHSKGLWIKLESVGNPDHRQYDSLSDPVWTKLKDLWEAPRVCRDYIDTWQLGGGNWTNPVIIQDGKPIAYVSYNGRLWKPGSKNNPEDEILP